MRELQPLARRGTLVRLGERFFQRSEQSRLGWQLKIAATRYDVACARAAATRGRDKGSMPFRPEHAQVLEPCRELRRPVFHAERAIVTHAEAMTACAVHVQLGGNLRGSQTDE